jgi:antitoxin component YwqK of YwqJK toxin-antitoxin module
MRPRWKEPDGTIYEWDSQHGTVEKYDADGNHLGEFDQFNGKQTGPAISTRSVEP